MKCKYKSILNLKQQLICLLTREVYKFDFDVVFTFESTISKRICSLMFVSNKRLEVCINLSHVEKAINAVECSLTSKVRYCVWFISDYIRQIERAKKYMPQSYFEGLVFLNAVEIYKGVKTVSVNSPLYGWTKKPQRNYYIRPIEICSAINSLNRMRLCASSEMCENEIILIDTMVDKLLLYASLPEVAYGSENVPVFVLVNSFRKLSTIITDEPNIAQKFPVLTLSQLDQINQLSTKELFLICVQSNSNFLIGVAIRIIAFLQLPNDFPNYKSVNEKLIEAMTKYIEHSLIYYRKLSDSSECFLKDNLYAVKKATKAINDYLNIYGYNINSGNIHSIE